MVEILVMQEGQNVKFAHYKNIVKLGILKKIINNKRIVHKIGLYTNTSL